MHEVARLAVLDRIGKMDRAERIRQTTDYVMVRDAEALRLLSE
jgi:hypothetical protein